MDRGLLRGSPAITGGLKGAESGLRAAVEQGWAAIIVDASQPIETELVAWREEMRGHLDNAQDYLSE